MLRRVNEMCLRRDIDHPGAIHSHRCGNKYDPPRERGCEEPCRGDEDGIAGGEEIARTGLRDGQVVLMSSHLTIPSGFLNSAYSVSYDTPVQPFNAKALSCLKVVDRGHESSVSEVGKRR
ncbi:hypothetical protein KM043_015905 [Ampulex compressa]|nr:hypothetical protein KM043_015905 [Ampulex compressa]